jgi:hypothetical protein
VPWVPKYARNALVKMPVLRSWSSALLASAAERIEATGAPQALRRTFSSSSLQKGILPHRADADAPRVAALCTGALSLSPWCTCTYVAQRAPWTRTPVERSARGRSGTTRRPARHSCGGTRRGCARTASKSWSTRARCLGRTCALRPRSQASTGFEDTVHERHLHNALQDRHRARLHLLRDAGRDTVVVRLVRCHPCPPPSAPVHM